MDNRNANTLEAWKTFLRVLDEEPEGDFRKSLQIAITRTNPHARDRDLWMIGFRFAMFMFEKGLLRPVP